MTQLVGRRVRRGSSDENGSAGPLQRPHSGVSEVLFNAGSTPWGMAPGQLPGQHHPGMPVPPPGMPHAALHYPPPAHPAAMAPPPGVHPPYNTLSVQEMDQ